MKYFLLQILLSIFLLCLNIRVQAYQKNIVSDSIAELKKAEWEMMRGYRLGSKIYHDSSKIYFKTAKSVFEKYEDWDSYVKSHFYEGLMYFRRGSKDTALVKYDNTLKIALKKLKKSNYFIAQIYKNIGYIYYSMDLLDRAVVEYLKAISYHKYVENDKKFIFIYIGLSQSYYSLSDFEKSSDFLEKAYRIIQKDKINLNAQTRYLVNKMELCYAKKKYKEIDALGRLVLELNKNSKNNSGKINAYAFLGRGEYKLGNFKEAIKWLNMGLLYIAKVKHEMGSLGVMHEANFRVHMGKVFLELHDYKRAHQLFFKAYLPYKEKRYSYVKYKFGSSHLNLNKCDSALYYFQEAMIDACSNYHNTNIYHNPDIHKALEKKRYLRLLYVKSKAFYLKYQSDNFPNIKDLNASYYSGLSAMQMIDYMNNSFGSSNAKLELSELSTTIYEQAIKTSLLLYKTTGDRKYLNKSLLIAEQSKTNVLLSELKSTNAKYFTNLPDSILAKEKDQKSMLAYHTTQINKELDKKEKVDSVKLNTINEKIFVLKRQQDSLETYLENQYPKYHELKYSKDSLDIEGLQNYVLDDKTTVVEYFLGDSSNYAFVITKEKLEVKHLPFVDSLDAKVKSLPILLKAKNKQSFSEIAHQLYQQFVAPLGLETSNLIIIPDGELWQLNFDLLLSQKPSKLDYRKFQYLIKDYTVSYAYSAKLLEDDLQKRIRPTQKECLAFSYNNPDDISTGNYIAMRGFRDSKLGDLPGTRKEIKAVSSVVDGSYYFGSYANEKNFKENAKDYKILHLALHGVIDNEKPMNSKLYFTQDKDSLEDNYLHAYELYNLELNAELAVLSACNTGSGKLIRGEGVMSLGRAFTYAGCKSLLLSQWDVSDAFTPGIMKDFYQNLKDGKTKAGALREAKLAYLNKADNLTSNPYYWAPLVQLGDNRPLKQDNYMAWVIGVTSLMVVVGLGIYWRRRKV